MPDPTVLSVLTFHDKKDNWLELQKSLGLGVRFAFGVYGGKMLKVFPHSLQCIKAEVIQTLKQETQKWVENTKP